MPTDNPQTQSQKAGTTRVNERLEQGAHRVEQQVHSASEAAIQHVRDARERAESGLEQQRSLVADRVRRVSEALRHTSDQLSRQDQFAQGLLDNASTRVQRVAEYIETAQLQDVAHDVQTFARRQPAYFFGGAFLVGLALGRFAKSSQSASLHDRSEAEQPRRALPPRVESAQRAPGYDVSSGSETRAVPPTPTTVGSAAGTGVSYAAPTNEAPKAQPSPSASASVTPTGTQSATAQSASTPSVSATPKAASPTPKSPSVSPPRSTEPGQGSKS